MSWAFASERKMIKNEFASMWGPMNQIAKMKTRKGILEALKATI